MELYVGMDLHSRNTYFGILNEEFKRIFKKRVKNGLPMILNTLEPFKDEVKGIVVESTYNWYWLVDGLMDAGYVHIHLANPSAIKQYEGLKYTDDPHDAFWLAKLLALGILPEGYIYPKESRPVRDLLRRRSFLVRNRTRYIHSLQSMIERYANLRLSGNDLKKLEMKDIEDILKEEHLVLSGETCLENIKSLTRQINRIQKAVKSKMRIHKPFDLLMTIPGIGEILALTIMLEVGDIGRFPSVGDFTSYCRCVPTDRRSAGKSKGKGNSKNGNRYLAWAFVEASNFARGFNERFRRYYQRKASKKNKIVATKALGSKLARISYYIMRDQVPFREEAAFC